MVIRILSDASCTLTFFQMQKVKLILYKMGQIVSLCQSLPQTPLHGRACDTASKDEERYIESGAFEIKQLMDIAKDKNGRHHSLSI